MTTSTPDSSANPRGAGRPPGSIRQFDAVLKQELEQTFIMTRRIRKSIGTTLARLEKLGENKHEDLEAQTQIMKSLETLVASQLKSLESVMKYLPQMQAATAGPQIPTHSAPAKTTQEVLEALEKGDD